MKPSLIGLMLTMFMASLDTSIANAGLPSISKAFSAPFPMTQWVVLAYLLTVTTLIVSVGKLGDLWGRKNLLSGGVAVFTLSSVVCGFAPNLVTLIAARAIQGIGAAAMLALAISFVAETVPSEKKGWAMGLMGTMSALGTALGPTLGGLLMSRFGWPAIFLVNMPVGLVNLYLVNRFLSSDHRVGTGVFDIWGTALLGAGLACYAMSLTLDLGGIGLNAVLGIAALILTGVFVLQQLRSKSPLVSLKLMSNRSIGSGLAMSFAVSTVIMTTLVVGPFYLSHAFKLDQISVGIVLSIGPAVVALLGPFAGQWADKYGARRLSILGTLIMVFGSVAMCLVPFTWGVLGYIANIITVTAGYSIFQTSNNTVLMSESGVTDRGVVSGLMNLTRNLGLITGAAAMGALFSLSAGKNSENLPIVVSNAMRVTFSAAVVLLVTGMLFGYLFQAKRSPSSQLKAA